MTERKLNIVFWGEDTFSCIILRSLVEAGHHVKLVVTPLYENLVYKKLEYTCNTYNILLLRIKKINSEETYEAVKKQIQICVSFHILNA